MSHRNSLPADQSSRVFQTYGKILFTVVAMHLVGCSPESEPRPQNSVQSSPSDLTGSASSREPEAEATLSAQIHAVENGESRSITLEQQLPTREDLRKLAGLKELQVIQFDAGLADASDLFELSGNQSVIQFRLRLTPVNDLALAYLADSFPSLQILNLPVLELTSSDSEHFSKFTKLTSLRIGGECIDSRLVGQLAKSTKLKHLHLISPNLVDDDLKVIAEIESLRSFYLDDCELSSEAWEGFFKLRPNIHVHLDQLHHDYDPNKHPS